MTQASETSPRTRGSLNEPTSGPGTEAQRLLAVRIFAGLWVAFLLLVPLRYYVLPDHDPYDERFAWRMFSAVRVQQCETEVEETLFGEETRPVNLQTSLPAPWISLLQRSRPAVVESFLQFRCESEAHPTRVSVESRCTDVTGSRLAPVRRSIDCESRAIEVVVPSALEGAAP
jgi:hypothetical protein